ncbi:MAG: nucleotide sugar dehydrogenase [Myxococcales bacterium FL481]|nr:MAG: nucleotide sugar dehydrogenase [Myxococcales bacterium FL481]
MQCKTERDLASNELMAKIQARQAHVVVIGAGYVGVPLAVELAEAGVKVTAYDKDPRKVDLLNAGESYIEDIPSTQLRSCVSTGLLSGANEAHCLREADVVLVCVPTPLTRSKEPDLSYVEAAISDVVAHQHPGMLVVLESTTYPGTTREVVVPLLTERFELGEDVFVAFSPERVDPGNKVYQTRNTPKVVGGASPACQKVATALYGHVVDRVVPVSSTDAAEMVKLVENTFRAVNVGLVNELAQVSRALRVDIAEVIDAAATKPFGFMPFYPGPGLGGHCIPIDPLYLAWKLRTLNHESRFVALADQVNSGMPRHVARRAMELMSAHGKALRGARVLVAGVAYKRDISDVRESPAIDVIRELTQSGARVEFVDPHVREINEHGVALRGVPEGHVDYGDYDLVVVTTNHSSFDYEEIARRARLVLDTRSTVPGRRAGEDWDHNVAVL